MNIVKVSYRSHIITALRKRPYLEFSLSLFSRIWTEYEEIRSISPYSAGMRENMDQKISEYGQFSCSVYWLFKIAPEVCYNIKI